MVTNRDYASTLKIDTIPSDQIHIMYCFLKFFLIAGLVQAAALSLIFNTTDTISISAMIADSSLFLFCYVLPTSLIVELSHPAGGHKIEVSAFDIVVFPAIFYSVLFALSVCLVKRIRKQV